MQSRQGSCGSGEAPTSYMSTQQQSPAHSPVPLANHTPKTSSSGAALSVVGTELVTWGAPDQTSHTDEDP